MDPVDWRALGLDAARLSREALDARLQRAARRTWDRLRRAGRLHPGVAPPNLALPPDFAEMLTRALRLEAREAADGWRQRAEGLITHYLELMPAMRLEQVATAVSPHAQIFHTPLDWACLPRLRAGVDALFALLAGAGVAPEAALGVPDRRALVAAAPTLAALYARTYFAGAMPVLYGFPADMAAIGREIDAGDAIHAVIDRRFAGPLVHELSHLGRDRVPLSPPYMDECVAGHLGVRALPSLAYPPPGADHAMFGAPWFAQVGQHLARVIGLDATIRAHAGVTPWSEVLPRGLADTFARWGWERYVAARGVHFLGEVARPVPWIKAMYLAAAGALGLAADIDAVEQIPWEDVPAPAQRPEDCAILADALRGLATAAALDRGAYRVTATVARDVVLDWERVEGRTETPRPLEVPPLRIVLSPAVAARWRAAGVGAVATDRVAPSQVDQAAAALADGELPGDGWRTVPRT